jgi:hypothetical protein
VLRYMPTNLTRCVKAKPSLRALIEDRSALFGVLGQIEALGLELLEVRRIHATPTSPAHTEPGPFDRRD